MTLKRPVNSTDEILLNNREQALEFIKGGAQVKSDMESTNDICHRLTLRIPVHAINKIDSLIAKKLGMTRTSWILQAIQDKLDKN